MDLERGRAESPLKESLSRQVKSGLRAAISSLEAVSLWIQILRVNYQPSHLRMFSESEHELAATPVREVDFSRDLPLAGAVKSPPKDDRRRLIKLLR